MTNKDILRIAAEQSAADANCRPEDFFCGHPVIVNSRQSAGARKYLKWPIECNLISYGHNVVASVLPQYHAIVADYIQRYPLANLMETPHLHVLEKAFSIHDLSICFMAEYFLPDINKLVPLPCSYELRTLQPQDFAHLYQSEWTNALCEKRKELDILAVGAYDNGKLVGLAGCSQDCDTMWQIGVDVLPAYRRQGIAASLTSHLALKILENGKVPFYCCAWCNIPSARNAIASGFKPAWVEMTVRPKSLVDKFNKA